MIVCGETIVLPVEDPLAFNLDWRHRVALAVTREPGHRLPRSLPGDRHLVGYATFLRQEEAKRDPGSVYSQAQSWHRNQVRYVIQALLITGGGYDEIAQILSVTREALTTYAKVFFDVRNEDGNVLSNAVLNAKFNQPVPDDAQGLILRNAALAGGLPLVKSMLAVRDDAPVDFTESEALRTLVNVEFSRRVLSGQMSAADLSRVIAAQASLEKMRLESDAQNKEVKKWKDFTIGFLGLTAPELLSPENEVNKAFLETFQKRLAAEKNIGATAVPDAAIEEVVKNWNGMTQR